MKKFVFLFAFFLTIPLMIFAQEIIPPVDWIEILSNPLAWIATFPAIAGVVMFLTAIVNGLLNVQGKFLKQLVSWLIGIIIAVLADLMNIGFTADMPLIIAALYGWGAGLAANGTFTIAFLKSILEAIETFFKSKTNK